MMVWDLIMYKEDKNGNVVKYSYEGDCSWICDAISEDDCKIIENKKERVKK
tara:strand:+ start:373 stop:525 length:153 start_codon:yes stop_codon:yes gene_type:complete